MIGTKLSHYEITRHLGSGGMGDVYQATDSTLGRSVAIKCLPEAFIYDPDRLARFEREARILASLNHPNIAAIHGLHESAGRKFLVMELVEGETLAERIERGPIAVDESLAIATQITEALEAAHEKGITHRDLKPANLKITPEGKVKVLDFGLSKAFEAEANSNLSQSPTLSMAATNAGVILGTAAYMSPEQAKGRPVDKRTDIFAFGCVLYEMLTAVPAFQGDAVGEILARVIEREPDWSKLPARTPPRIRELLRLCLQKDARKRRQTAADVRIDIEQALNPTAEIALAPAASRTRERLWMGAAALFLAGMASLAIVHFREAPAAGPPEMRTEIVTPDTTDPISFALSPDGRQIVFVASGDGASRLWVRSLTSTNAQPLAGTEGAAYPFWAPDSRSIGFFSDAKLKRLDVGGGLPQTLTEATVFGPRGGTWNADGVILFTPGPIGPLFRVSALGGEAVAVTKLDRQRSHRFPFFLPDGRRFLFLATGTPETEGIYLGALDSDETYRLTAAEAPGVYLSAGYLLWVRAGTLVAQHLDLQRKSLTGDPVALADAVAVDAAAGAGAVSVSVSGLVAYRTGGVSRRQLAWFDRSGKALGVMGAPDEKELVAASVSPDGRRVAVSRGVQGNLDIWLVDGTRTSRFTFDAGVDRFPIWSSDGSRIVFDSNRKVHRDLYEKPLSGGAEELLVESPQNKVATHWSADGQFILYQSIDPQTGWDLWVLPLADRKPWVFLKTSFQERNGQFSPDGRWVAYMSNESGQQQIYIRSFGVPAASGAPGKPAAGQWQVSTAGGIFPCWRADGKELYYIGPTGEMMAVPITATMTALEPGAPVSLFRTRIVGGGAIKYESRQYDVTSDGRFLINTVLDDGNSAITLLMNWKPQAK